ncbi:aspartate aminotransferase family protein [Lewinella sp. W8]|uniref:aspartate aminotransferase family protein n=1 Tax=Lewinella sp. W8 TaxID=2528208 RepID=UPI0010686547|nr:aspartate aminotransferase family protein [Lewinella sp. W8]MTB51101.1 aminotransferase class III-fold pyridoxal phosphate-dependent enzyme [Lewinella sp. W8]
MDKPAWLTEAEQTLIRYCGDFSPIRIIRAEGSYIYTDEGQAILDFTSGQMCSVFGHNHPRVVSAIHGATERSLHLLSTMLSPEVIELSQRLAALLPEGLDKLLFVNTGSESNEVAIRMAKLASGGYEIIGFIGSWHGMTAGAQSSTYSSTRRGYGPNIPGNLSIPAPYAYRCPIKHCKNKCDNSCLEVGMAMVDRQSVGAYAACIVEPVLSAAGIVELTPEYYQRLRELCAERGLYLILDEAQTAFGRLGTNFGYEPLGAAPDFLTLSKTLGGGLPLAATVTSKDIEENCFEKGFINITSHISDPLPAAVGLAMMDILLQEDMATQAAIKGAYLKTQLEALQERHECIGDVRGRGLLLGVEIVKDRNSREPDVELGHRISDYCLTMGLSMNIVRVKGMGGVFRIAPPLTITTSEIDLGVEILDQAIGKALGSRL